MPCYQINTISCEFSAKHLDVLELALVRLGWEYEILADGRMSIQGGKIVLNLDAEKATFQEREQEAVNQLKVQYSWEALQIESQHNGWSLQEEQGEHQHQGVLTKSNWG